MISGVDILIRTKALRDPRSWNYTPLQGNLEAGQTKQDGGYAKLGIVI